jgi:hypothetical protein
MIGRQPALLLSFDKVKSINAVQEVCCNQVCSDGCAGISVTPIMENGVTFPRASLKRAAR